MRKLVVIVIAAALVGLLARQADFLDSFIRAPAPDGQPIAKAFANRQSDLQVAGQGKVRRILPDDTTGRRHQKFILELATGQTLLIAHNIDIAPRIEGLREGDAVAFYGEYEWNPQGGVVHWTHRDPTGRHDDGWLKHENQIYQ